MSFKNRFFRLLFSWHGYVGLATGLALLLIGISGSVLVFQDELDGYFGPSIEASKQVLPTLKLDSLYHVATAHEPNVGGIGWMNPVDSLSAPYHFRLYLNDGMVTTYDLAELSLDPHTGKILRSGRYDHWSSGILQWIYQFHFSFHAGMPGTLFTALLGLTMLFSCITGALIFRKRFWSVILFRYRIDWTNKRRRYSDLHRVLGTWSMVFTMIIFFTGFWMNLFAFEGKTWKKKAQPSPPVYPHFQSMDKLMKKAKQAMPDLEIQHVYFPTQKDQSFRVSGRIKGDPAIFGNAARVVIDPIDAHLISSSSLAELSFSEKWEKVVQPLHAGSFAGWPIKVVYVLLGLIPGIMAITGFFLWKRRKHW